MNNVEKNVVKLECGKEKGNAVLIDKLHALTLKHCLKEYDVIKTPVFLFYFDGKTYIKITAVLSDITEDSDGFAILKLNETLNIELEDIKLVGCNVKPFSKFVTYGFDGSHLDRKVGHELKAISDSEDIPSEIISDLVFKEESKSMTLAGLSGSPVYMENYNAIIGLISCERTENGKSVELYGISVKSQMDFLKKNGIFVCRNIDFVSIDKKTEEILSIGRSQSITGLAVEISSSIYEYKLKEIIALYRKGYINQALNRLKQEIKNFETEQISNRIMAIYYYQFALWLLEIKGKVSSAKRQIEKALKQYPDLDIRKYKAVEAFLEGKENVLAYLGEIDSIEMLNAYLQICLNCNNIQHLLDTYEEYKEEYEGNETTYYLLSIAHLNFRQFEKSQEYIDYAIKSNPESPVYYMQKGLIEYWEIMPEYLFPENGIYPLMYSQIIYVPTEKERVLLSNAIENFKIAYGLMKTSQEKEYKLFILEVWIISVSVCGECEFLKREAVEQLKREDLYNIVLLADNLKNGILELSEYDLRQINLRINNHDKRYLEYISVLAQYMSNRGNEKEAKSFLFEHKKAFENNLRMDIWYEQIRQYLSKEEKEKYRKVIEDTNFYPNVKRRLYCLYSYDEKEEEKNFVALYDSNGQIIDLMNLLHFYLEHKRWNKLKNYAEILICKFNNQQGYIYKAQALICMKKYEKTIEMITEIESVVCISVREQLKKYKMDAYEGIGKYKEAKDIGEKIFLSCATDQMANKLANLSILLGDKESAIHYLEDAEKKHKLSKWGYQRLSVLYGDIDKEKSVEYAKKVVQEDGSANTKLWAYNHVAAIGKSKALDGLLDDVFQNINSIENARIVSLEEFIKMIQDNQQAQQKNEKLFLNGEIATSVVLDASSRSYASFYDMGWDTQKLVLFYGGHPLKESLEIKEFILDISACITLFRLNLLSVVCKHYKVYIFNGFMPLLMQEMEKLVPIQDDLYQKRKRILDFCIENEYIKKVNSVLPDESEKINIKNKFETILQTTAKQNKAIIISSGKDFLIQYQQQKQNVWNKKLLVNFPVLEEWENEGYLDEIAEHCELLILETEVVQLNQEIMFRKDIYKSREKVQILSKDLKELINKDKINFLPCGTDGSNDYSEIFIAELKAASNKEIGLCIDDRWTQSYTKVKNAPIFSSIDLIKELLFKGYITEQKYNRIWRKLIKQRVLYIFPDEKYILHCLEMLTVEKGVIRESEKLYELRAYINYAFEQLDKYGEKQFPHAEISEKKSYWIRVEKILFNLFQKIWRWNEEYEKKCFASNWIVMNVMRKGIYFDSRKNEYLDCIEIVELILQSFFLAMDNINNEEYNRWLCEMLPGLCENSEIFFENVIKNTTELICNSILNDEKLEKYGVISIVEKKIARAIYSMPGFIRKRMLKNEILSKIFGKFYEEVIWLDNTITFEKSEWEQLKNRLYAKAPSEVIEYQKDNLKIEFSWKYEIPCLCCIQYKWIVNEQEINKKRIICFAERLFSSAPTIRLSEYINLQNSYGILNNEQLENRLKKQETYELPAKEIYKDFRKKKKCQEDIIKYLLENHCFFDEDVEEYLVPDFKEFFSELYDFKSNNSLVSEIKKLSGVPGGIVEEKEIYNNPVREMNLLRQTIVENRKISDIMESILQYLYVPEKNIYGRMYLALLSWGFDAISNKFPEESVYNLTIWSYIWVDQIMIIVNQLEKQGFSVSDWKDELMNSKKKKYFENFVSNNTGEYLEPYNMSLLRICFIWPQKVIYDVKNIQYKEDISIFLKKFMENKNIIFNDSRNMKDIFGSSCKCSNDLNSSFYLKEYEELDLKLTQWINGQEDETDYITVIKNELRKILQKDSLEYLDNIFLCSLACKELDADTILLIENCMRKFVIKSENLDVQLYRTFYPHLNYISSQFLKEYQKSEYCKLKEKFIKEEYKVCPMLMEIAANLVLDKRLEPFIEFWSECAKLANNKAPYSFLDLLMKTQMAVPDEYKNEIYCIRTHFASI